MIVEIVPFKYPTRAAGFSSGNGRLLRQPQPVDVHEDLQDSMCQTIENSNAYLVFFTGNLPHNSYISNTRRARRQFLYLCEDDARAGTGPCIEIRFDRNEVHSLLTPLPNVYRMMKDGLEITAALSADVRRNFMYSLLGRQRPAIGFEDLTLTHLIGLTGEVQIQKYFGVYEDRAYVCDVCGQPFHKRKDLNGHVKTHATIKPYVRDITGCGERFFHQHELNRHTRRHSGIKP
ncbi:uncharacterized protein RHO25_006778 [Cercospora beticola]|uniref:C2H2-type domain-containing protein n=1 Tax=Cercospora beticola TaxID=122368 RepID=A0ABZ0NRH2_CERBT|nr:hypothetical protein RHO25_006778 [Cercospora beticola]CAK1363000.1 unnamed protein product [Cercospora beticola]